MNYKKIVIVKKPIEKLIERLELDDCYLEDTDRICEHCPYLHCGWYEAFNREPCPISKRKLKNKYSKLNKYVYENLRKYGNTLVSNETYDTLGEKAIIEDLKANGIDNVIIKITQDNTIILMLRKE